MECPFCSIGIDVSKRKLDVYVLPQEKYFTVGNNATGIQALLDSCQEWQPQVVVLEATGNYERRVFQALQQAGWPVRRINPRQSRSFAHASGKLMKTDKVDAYCLAYLGQFLSILPENYPIEKPLRLASLVKRRRQLMDMITMEKNHLEHEDVIIETSVAKHLNWLEAEVKRLDREITTFLRQNPEFAEKIQILKSVPGIGQVTLATLLAELPELGHLSNKKLTALVGLAPYSHDSGGHKGKRRIRGGRKFVRDTFYMATLVATRHNQIIRAFYQRLLSLGKPKKVALIACARKLLTIINAMVKNKVVWQPQPAESRSAEVNRAVLPTPIVSGAPL